MFKITQLNDVEIAVSDYINTKLNVDRRPLTYVELNQIQSSLQRVANEYAQIVCLYDIKPTVVMRPDDSHLNIDIIWEVVDLNPAPMEQDENGS
jgi:hypothetical protein